MICPKCKNPQTRVLDSRDTNEQREIRRRRKCEKCDYRFTTFEQVETANFMVIKKDNSRENYDQEKIIRGIWRACEKRPVTKDQVDKIINDLEEEWSTQGKEVSTQEIGESVLKKLRNLDEVAYIRFASVYKDFQNIENFRRELEKLR